MNKNIRTITTSSQASNIDECYKSLEKIKKWYGVLYKNADISVDMGKESPKELWPDRNSNTKTFPVYVHISRDI